MPAIPGSTGDPRHWFWRVEERATQRAYLILILLIAALLRFTELGKLSLWHDELISVFLAKLSFSDQLAHLVHDRHAPLYTFLLHYWLMLGDSDVWVRLLSALCGWATCGVGFLLGRALHSPVFGLLCAALLAVSPYLVWTSQEARCYAIFGFEVSLGALAALSLARNPDSKPALWAYAMACAAQFYTYYLAVGPVFATALLLLIELARAKRLQRWAQAHGLALLLSLPLIPLMWSQMLLSGNQGSLPSVTSLAGTVDRLARQVLVATDPWWTLSLHPETRHIRVVPVLAGLALVVLILGVIGMWRLRGSSAARWQALPLLCAANLLFSCALGVAYPDIPLWRYQVANCILQQMLVAAVLMALRRTWIVLLYLVLVARWELGLVAALHNTPKDQIREAVGIVASEQRPDDALLFNRESAMWLCSHYIKPPPPQFAVQVMPGGTAVSFSVGDVYLPIQEKHLFRLGGRLAGYRRLWIYYGYDVSRSELDTERSIVNAHWSARGFSKRFSKDLAGVVLERFDRVRP